MFNDRSTLEAFVFLLLGGELMAANHVWNGGFIGWSILLILVGRAVSKLQLNIFNYRLEIKIIWKFLYISMGNKYQING